MEPAPEIDRRPTDPRSVVVAFLEALAAGDSATAKALVADDIVYINVGMPPLRGAAKMAKVLDLLDRPSLGFEFVLHAISADGPAVLTERTDVLLMGRFRAQFWVWGRFEVFDGRITLWRDSFDYLDLVRGNLRGLLALAFPASGPRPRRPEDAPGR